MRSRQVGTESVRNPLSVANRAITPFPSGTPFSMNFGLLTEPPPMTHHLHSGKDKTYLRGRHRV